MIRSNLKDYYKYVIFAVFLLLLSIIILFNHNYDQGINFLKKEFMKQQMLIARQTSVGIEENIKSLSRVLANMAKNRAVASSGKRAMDYFFREQAEELKNFDITDILVINNRGVVSYVLNAANLSGRGFSSRKFFTESSHLKTNTPVYDFSTYGDIGDPGKDIIVAMPLFSELKNFSGAIVCVVRSEELFKKFIPGDSDETVFNVMDRDLNVLFHHGEEGGFSSKFVLQDEEHQKSYREFIRQLKNGDSFQMEYSAPDGTGKISSVAAISLNGSSISIVVTTPVSSVLNRLDHITAEFMTSAVAAIVVLFLCAVIVIFFLGRFNSRLMNEIGSREEAETVLREGEERFRALFDKASDCIFMLEIDETAGPMIKDMNIAACEVHGYRRDEIAGKPVKFIAHQDTVKSYFASFMNPVSGDGIRFEGEHLRMDGSAFPVEISAQRIKLGDKQYAIVSCRDLTKQRSDDIMMKRYHDELELRVRERTSELREANNLLLMEIIERNKTEELLVNQNELIKNTLEAITHPFYVVDVRDYSVVIANSAANSTTLKQKWKCYELVKKLKEPCCGEDNPCPILEIQRTKKQVTYEHIQYSHDENAKFYEVHGYPIFDLKGEVVRIIEYMIDITDRKRLEDQLNQSQKIESIGRLAGGIAHDFNNLLSVILTYCDLAVIKMEKTHPAMESIRTIMTAAEKAAQLPKQLLAFSRKQMLKMRVISLNLVIDRMITILERMIGGDILIEFHRTGDLRNVKADTGQIEQILMNLAVNARDAMPLGGKLLIETGNAEIDSSYSRKHDGVFPGNYALISVTDTGIGMSRKVQKRIFEPFFTTKNDMGTGLGLATVHGIVKQHSGHISVYSEPGIGTTFKIYLPATTEPAEAVMQQVESAVEKGNETILIVDDDASIRSLAIDSLKPLGYNILTASSGEAAVKKCEDAGLSIQLLLTDVIMPGMNGGDLSENIRKIIPSIKIIFTSGYSSDIISSRIHMDDDRNFIQKPLTPGKLARKIREVLDT